ARQICACDGTTQAIQYGCDLPKGYEQQVVSHEGACESAPPVSASNGGHD
ncbi:MAG: hypothetical protein JWO86_7546, partial [Myxococcaceae bacterium]|nr:hypothetical protein [Myxococcaceae bacterium]